MKKFLKITGITVLVLLLFLIAAPFLFKNKIIRAAKNFANTQLNAKMNFDESAISLSFFRSFPDVSLGMEKITVVGIDSFAGDTLMNLPEMRLTLDIKSLFSGNEIKVKRVYLNKPMIDIQYLSSGRANWDIFKADTTKKPSDTAAGFKLALKSFEIEKGHVIYNDRSLGFFAEMRDVDHESSGDFTADQFVMQTLTKTPSLDLSYGGIPWIHHINTTADAMLTMDMKQMKFAFDKADVKMNELNIKGAGWVDLNEDDMDMDINFKAVENSFKNFLSLVPGMYSADFKDMTAGGTMALQGSLKGKMTDTRMPATDIKLQVNNGSFKYPSLSYPADNIFIDMHFTNPDGAPDNSVVDLSKFNLRLAGEPFQAKLLLKTPVSDPYIDGSVKGKIDLEKVRGMMPLEKGTELRGLVNADLQAKGHYSAAANKDFGRLDASGKLSIIELFWKLPTDKYATEVSSLMLDFTPATVHIVEFKGHIAKNDFDISGRADNVIGYAFGDETLKGQVKLQSNYLNVNEFMSDEEVPEEPKPSDTGLLSVVELPHNIDMNLDAKIGKLIYDNYILTDLSGNTHMHDGKIDLKGMSAKMLDGEIELDGTYDSNNPMNPFTEMTTKLTGFNIGKTFSTFTIFQKFAPITEHLNGIFNAGIEMSSILNQRMQPNYGSMNVKGFISLTKATMSNLDVFNKIGAQLKVDWLKNLEIKDQKFSFLIQDGVFKLLDSLRIPLPKGAFMKLAGMSKLDRTINYGGWLKIPREAFGEANTVLNKYISLANTKKWKLELEKLIPVDLAISGNILDPKVLVSLAGFKQAFVDNLKDQGTQIAKDEANKKLKGALDKAQKEADKIIAEAKKRADQLRAEGKKTAEKIRVETRAKADQARAETKAKTDQLKAEGDRQAKKVLDEANAKIDEQAARAKTPTEKILAQQAAKKLKAEAQKQSDAVKADYNRKVGAAQAEGDKRVKQVEDEGYKRADQVEEEANSNADKIEAEAKERADKVMTEARERGEIK